MDPFPDGTVSGITFLSKPARTPRQMALNLSAFDNPGNSHFYPVSGLIGVSIKKGLPIAGFSLFSSRISIIDPFPDVARNWSNPGIQGYPTGGQKGQKLVETGSKEAKYSPSEAQWLPEALVTGYLDLSNTCSGWPGTGSGYRAQMSEDTVTVTR